jgi:hypothetical protein
MVRIHRSRSAGRLFAWCILQVSTPPKVTAISVLTDKFDVVQSEGSYTARLYRSARLS